MYDPNLEIVGEPRILFWLGLDSWTLSEAAMVLCDIDPQDATLDDHDRLTRCSVMEGRMYDYRTPRVDLRDPEVDPRDVGPWNIDDLASEFRDMRHRLQSAVSAGKANATMAPTAWVNFAEEKNIPVPWLEWVRSNSGEFPWLQSEARGVGVGPSNDGESHKPALDIEPTAAVRGKNIEWVWKVEARRTADELHLKDKNLGVHSSKKDLADRVAKSLRERGIEGPRGPLRGATILREALNPRSWKRKP
jgi:hypothetical protein